MFKNTGIVDVFAAQNIYNSPSSSIETSTSQDSFSSTMSENAPSPDSTENPGKPYLKIIEQPAGQFRFRYKSEMQGTHGAILGAKATKAEKTHPTVKLFNYEGQAIIRCTLYTAENKRRRPHVHRLVGKLSGRAEKDDPHDLRIGPRENYTSCFQNLVIIHTAKKVLVDELLGKKKRIMEARFTRKLEIDGPVIEKMRLEAEEEAKGMNMNSVSLKFEALTLVNQQYVQICEPVYSQPINNMKSHVTGQLRICRLSKFYSSCEGGDEILLFVEKVGKNNIKVLFTELDDDGNEIWRDYATHVEVHHQFGISCRCPKYKSQDLSREVLVKMQLERPSDGARSETRDFVYKPTFSNKICTENRCLADHNRYYEGGGVCRCYYSGKRKRLDSIVLSPQIPDSTFEPQISTYAADTLYSSTVLQSSNVDPLLQIEKSYQDDYVVLRDTLLTSHLQDESMNEGEIEENASSSISFSAEINKYPTPTEPLINEFYSSDEFQRAFQEEAVLPERGELVPDSFFTRNCSRSAVQSSSNASVLDGIDYFVDLMESKVESRLSPGKNVKKNNGKIEAQMGRPEIYPHIFTTGEPAHHQSAWSGVDKGKNVVRHENDFGMEGPEPKSSTLGQIYNLGRLKPYEWVRVQVGSPRQVSHQSHTKGEPAHHQSAWSGVDKGEPAHHQSAWSGVDKGKNVVRHENDFGMEGPEPKSSTFGQIYNLGRLKPYEWVRVQVGSPRQVSHQSHTKVQAKDFLEHTLQRLNQIIDTAVFPHVTKVDIENKLLMEFEIRTELGDSVLHTAIRWQQFKLVKQLLNCIKSHVDDLSPVVNCQNLFTKVTPLHVAVQSNDDQCKDIVEYLLELGADPNKPEISEFTPLHLAVTKNNLKAAKYLLDYPGVNINQVSANMGTALHIAAEDNRYEMAKLLIEHGADINSIDLQKGQTSLHVAIKKSNLQIVDLLLKQTDIDINKEDYRCQTPLKFAILRADTRLMKIVNKLINHGASYESFNATEETDDSLENIQEDEKQSIKSRKMQTLAFLFSQISVAENNTNVEYVKIE